jgi:hypothetical protein
MSRVGWIVLVAVWGAAAAWGSWQAIDYEMTVSPLQSPPQVWPAECNFARFADRPTLLVFVHPKCPCTRATLRELERLLARPQQRVNAYAIFLRPEAAPADWEQTDLLATAKTLPGIQVIVDGHGENRRMFRMSTSGEILFYGTDGRLQFHGGITSGRGHEGDSLGQSVLSALLRKQSAPVHRTPVFGCALERKKECCEASP